MTEEAPSEIQGANMHNARIGAQIPIRTEEEVLASQGHMGDPNYVDKPLSGYPHENAALAHEMVAAEYPAQRLIANIEALPDLPNREELLRNLSEDAERLAEEARDKYLGEQAIAREKERQEETNYRAAINWLVGNILAAPEFKKVSAERMWLKDTHNAGNDLVRIFPFVTGSWEEERGGGLPLFGGTKLTAEQSEKLRVDLYKMLGAEPPRREGLHFDDRDDEHLKYFGQEAATVETPTNTAGITVVEIVLKRQDGKSLESHIGLRFGRPGISGQE